MPAQSDRVFRQVSDNHILYAVTITAVCSSILNLKPRVHHWVFQADACWRIRSARSFEQRRQLLSPDSDKKHVSVGHTMGAGVNVCFSKTLGGANARGRACRRRQALPYVTVFG